MTLSAPSARLIRAGLIFGLEPGLDAHAPRQRAARHAARRLDRALAPGEVALICGPSGAGKSLIVRALRHRLGRRAIATSQRFRSRSVLDAVAAHTPTLDSALQILSAAGLADATLLARPPRFLSDGQRARLSLAIAMARLGSSAPRGRTLVCDEFGSTLDAITALGLCRTVRRWAARTGARIVAATSRERIIDGLAPHVLVCVRPPLHAEVLRVA